MTKTITILTASTPGPDHQCRQRRSTSTAASPIRRPSPTSRARVMRPQAHLDVSGCPAGRQPGHLGTHHLSDYIQVMDAAAPASARSMPSDGGQSRQRRPSPGHPPPAGGPTCSALPDRTRPSLHELLCVGAGSRLHAGVERVAPSPRDRLGPTSRRVTGISNPGLPTTAPQGPPACTWLARRSGIEATANQHRVGARGSGLDLCLRHKSRPYAP